MRLIFALGLVAVSLASLAQAPGGRLAGDWKEPGGSVVRIAACGSELCLTLVTLPPNPPALVDHHNPDAALRTRPLCGLQIGYGFHPAAPDRATDGRLYDPRAGKTYHGEMTLRGDQLSLRGYVGFKALGRTELWTRTPPVTACRG